MSNPYNLGPSTLDVLDTITISSNTCPGSYSVNMSSITGGTYALSGGTNAVWDTGTISTSWPANNALDVKGDASFAGEVTIKGKSLTDTLARIEERLAILHPNAELESRWDDLKSLADQYRALEKEIIEKEKMWNILKK